MARYNYKCTNDKCEYIDELTEVVKPMSGATKEEKCKGCKEPMVKDYKGLGGIVTGDGVKT